MPRPKLSYQERVFIEESLKQEVSKSEICERLGLSTYELQLEIRRGQSNEDKTYSANRSQMTLR